MCRGPKCSGGAVDKIQCENINSLFCFNRVFLRLHRRRRHLCLLCRKPVLRLPVTVPRAQTSSCRRHDSTARRAEVLPTSTRQPTSGAASTKTRRRSPGDRRSVAAALPRVTPQSPTRSERDRLRNTSTPLRHKLYERQRTALTRREE